MLKVELGSLHVAGRPVISNAVLRPLSRATSDLGDDFQRFNLIAIQFEEESKINRAAWKVAG